MAGNSCSRGTILAVCLALAGSALMPVSHADSTTVLGSRDTAFNDSNDATSNGAGRYACIGQNGQSASSRGLFRFDVSSIPAGATITGATLSLWLTPNSQGPTVGTIDAHLLLEDWGEGTSDAPQGECQGTAAAGNDATWDYRFYPGTQWTTLGGTFVSPPSASLSVTNSAGFKNWTSAQLATDVQGWVDSGGATNFGWLLKADVEDGSGTALRFDTRQNGGFQEVPRIRLTFDPPPIPGACCLLGETCIETTAGDCVGQGGYFQGEATSCAATVCIDPVGACCAADGLCTEVDQLGCQAAGGSYQGDGGSCGSTHCPILLEPFVDALPRPAVAQPNTGSPGSVASYTISMREVQQQLHRDLPPTTVWGYGDGPTGATFPGPTIEAGVDQPVTVEFVNDIRDSSAVGDPKPYRTDHYLAVAGTAPPPECQIHGAENRAKAVVHLHGGHVPAIYDGYPEDAYGPGNSLTFVYPNDQIPGTIWYHDHALGITRLNVYMGLAGFYLIRDPFEQALGLPSGEFEIPLAIQDRSFNPDGSLSYPADIQEVFFGDFVLVNGKVWPYLDVKQGKYRFRMLNGSGSRSYTMSLDRLDQPGTTDLPFVQIGTGGGLIELPLPLDEITLAPAERADVIVDFAGLPVGTEIVLTNSAPAPYPGTPGVGVLPDVMKFVVTADPGYTTAIPAGLRSIETLDEGDSVKTRDFTLQKSADACGGIWKINDLAWDDITEYPQLGATEIWRFINPSNVTHPMHMHLVFFQLLDRVPIGGGTPVPPDANEVAWKDTVRADPGMVTRVIARFEDYSGKYAYHCHILEHEDHEMMRQFFSVDPIPLSIDGDRISWPGQIGASGYDVLRGDLIELRTTDGNYAFSSVTESCLAHNTASTTFDDTTPLNDGEGFWYLIRAIDPGGKATYDTGRESQFDHRDDEIAVSGNDCP